jgi:protein TonB
MKPKKNPKISLENNRLLFFQAGIVAALALALFAFEWSTFEKKPSYNEQLFGEQVASQEEIILSTKRKEPKKHKKPRIIEIINLVDDHVTVEEPEFWNPEPTKDYIPDIWEMDQGDEEDFTDEPYEFITVQHKPLFNGGDPSIEFRKYIASKLQFPQEAINNGLGGRVVVSFVIDKKGNLTNIQILDSPHRSLSEEAVRVLKSSPRWTPGRQRTRPVPVRFIFPVVFRLN